MNYSTSHSQRLHDHRPTKLGRSRLRSTRLVLIDGLAAGAGFAGVTEIASASSGTSPASSTVAPSTNSSANPGRSPATSSTGPGGAAGGHGPRSRPRGRPGGPRGPLGLGPKGGHRGRGGTITAINGSTLTLRTMNGTEVVDTSSSTTYTKELQTISFSDLKVGEVVHVRRTPVAGTPTSSSSSSSTPPQPGTGTVNASRVEVIEPSLAGRVTSASNGTYDLVGMDGQLLTVSTTGSTRYYSGTSQTSSSALSDGAHIRAEGAQDSLTHLTADVIMLARTPPSLGSSTSPGPSGGSSSSSPGRSSSTTQAPVVGS